MSLVGGEQRFQPPLRGLRTSSANEPAGKLAISGGQNKTLQMPELELVAQPKLHHAPRIQLRGIVPKTAAEYVNKGVYGLHVEAH